MSDYHEYVFDLKARSFLGRFDDMYRAERDHGFDSWYQEDLRNISKSIALVLLERYNFDRILDIGCGKGAFTHLLKKQNNHVTALDISQTALDVARGRYPDIQFIQADVTSPGFDLAVYGSFDLVLTLEILSYVGNWTDLVTQCSRVGRYALIVLFVPDNPIGYVKSFRDLIEVFAARFDILENIHLCNRQQIILFGQSKNGNLI